MVVTEGEQDSLSALLREDLTAFADPGAPLELAAQPDDWFAASWQQGGRRRTAQFLLRGDPSLGVVRVRDSAAAADVSYATFLADDRMGDLKGLARNTLNVIGEVRAYVPPRAIPQSEGQGNGAGEQADQLVASLATAATDGTKVVFITAEAGVGKTSLLTHLVRSKAEGYLRGEERALWLYVNAQGSRLARLDQALAETLDDLRAHFTYHAATALVRSEALVLVIDGFDELIGTQGTYDEAFSSLASFIEGLRGSGSIVAAARSAYYEQEFATRADSTIGFRTDRWSLQPITLCDWNQEERNSFLARFADLAESNKIHDLQERVEGIFADETLADLAGKPLFVSRIAQLVAEGVELEAGGDNLVHRLMSTYVRREANERLVSSSGAPILTVEQMTELYTEIANEMWRQETRELSRTSLRELVDILTDLQGLDDEARLVVVERTPYAAVMRTGSVGGSVAFEHELYFSYFLAQPIVEAVRSGDPLTAARALRKARLPEQAGFLAGRSLTTDDVQAIVDLIEVASRAMSTGSERVRENGGLILSGILNGRTVADLRIRGIDFVDCDLTRAEIRKTTFVDCAFRGVDMRATKFIACSAQDVLMETVILDRTSRLQIDGLPIENFIGVVMAATDGTRTILYAPDELQMTLAPLGLPAAQKQPPPTRAIDPQALALVKRFSRLYETTNLTTAEDANVMRTLVQDRFWEDVLATLVDAEIITREKRSAAGNKVFMRMNVRPRDLLAGQSPHASADPRVRQFWEALEERVPVRS